MIFKKLKLVTDQLNHKFKFNWQRNLSEGQIIFAMIVNETVIGLISFIPKQGFLHITDLEITKSQQHKHFGTYLLTFAIYLSVQAGDDGFVNLESKTNGVQNFYKKLGGFFVGSQNCIFQPPQSIDLLNAYTTQGGFKIEKSN